MEFLDISDFTITAILASSKVVAAGKSGFPELPTVSAMLDASTQTLSGISKQAQKLQQQMLDVQQDGGLSSTCP